MAGMNTTPGNWGRGYRSSPKVSKGFGGSRGFSMPKTASGKVARMTQKPLRGEEDLYSMLGKPIGDEMSPYSAEMITGPYANYTPPGTGLGMELPGPGVGDLGQIGSGSYDGPISVEDPGYAIAGTKNNMASSIWGLGKGLISPMPGYGEDEGFGGYMGEDFMGEFLPPSYLPKEKPRTSLNPAYFGSYMWEGIGYGGDMTVGGSGMAYEDNVEPDSGPEKFGMPSRMVTTDSPLQALPLKRRGVVCPPGDPNCR